MLALNRVTYIKFMGGNVLDIDFKGCPGLSILGLSSSGKSCWDFGQVSLPEFIFCIIEFLPMTHYLRLSCFSQHGTSSQKRTKPRVSGGHISATEPGAPESKAGLPGGLPRPKAFMTSGQLGEGKSQPDHMFWRQGEGMVGNSGAFQIPVLLGSGGTLL